MAQDEHLAAADQLALDPESKKVTPKEAEAFEQLRAARGKVKFAAALRKLKADR